MKNKDEAPNPRIKVIEDNSLRTLQLRITRIANGLLFKPGYGTYYAKNMDEVRAMVNKGLDQFEEALKQKANTNG